MTSTENTNPLVSVILTAYNSEKTLEKCLTSLINQTYESFEVICINDGSSDNTLKIFEDFSQKDNRIKVFSQENKGVAYSRNRAFNLVQSKYIMFCDADDTCEPTYIEDMVTAIEEQNVDIAMCDCNIIDLSDNTAKRESYANWCRLKLKNKHEINEKNVFVPNTVVWNKIFKKELIEKYEITYPEKYEHDDTVFFFKYIINCSSYYGIDKALYNYTIGNSNSIMGKYLTQKDLTHQFDFASAMQDVFDYIKTHKTIYEKQLIETMYGHIRFFYLKLNPELKKDGYKHIMTLVKNNKDLLKNHKNFSKILKINSFNKFECFINNECHVSFLEQIFSIKNSWNGPDKKYKIIRILGMKFNINLKK